MKTLNEIIDYVISNWSRYGDDNILKFETEDDLYEMYLDDFFTIVSDVSGYDLIDIITGVKEKMNRPTLDLDFTKEIRVNHFRKDTHELVRSNVVTDPSMIRGQIVMDWTVINSEDHYFTITEDGVEKQRG